jgi:hypothetical protein
MTDIMKYFKTILTLFLLASIFSLDIYCQQPENKHKPNQHNNPGKHQKHGSVGAPLDGGFLAVLGAAGVAYFAGRKKKKDSGV